MRMRPGSVVTVTGIEAFPANPFRAPQRPGNQHMRTRTKDVPRLYHSLPGDRSSELGASSAAHRSLQLGPSLTIKEVFNGVLPLIPDSSTPSTIQNIITSQDIFISQTAFKHSPALQPSPIPQKTTISQLSWLPIQLLVTFTDRSAKACLVSMPLKHHERAVPKPPAKVQGNAQLLSAQSIFPCLTGLIWHHVNALTRKKLLSNRSFSRNRKALLSSIQKGML